MSHPDARRHLAELVRGSAGFSVAEAALWIAADDLPEIDPPVYLARLDSLAARARLHSPGAADGSAERCAAVCHSLFHEEGFVGNTAEYDDPRNSYLSEVLDRRTGLPITLSVVFIEAARRAGLAADGLNFPGHFLAVVRHSEGIAILDPFHGGAELTVEELQARWQDATQGPPPPPAVLLAPADGLAVVLRMLNNLRRVYLQRGELDRAIATVEKMVLIHPLGADQHRDLGALYLMARAFNKAIESLERYLQLVPNAADAGAVRARLRSATQMIARWN